MRLKYLITACVLAMTVGATMATNGVAQASTIQGTISGTIKGYSTIDVDGLFGSPGADLANSILSLSFSYDPASCVTPNCGYGHFGSEEVLSYWSGVSVSVTINSHQQDYLSSNGFGSATLAAGPAPSTSLINLGAYQGTNAFASTFIYSSHTWALGDIFNAATVDAMIQNLLPGVIELGDGHTNEFLDFTPLQSTPLPAALPLFASGLGALGLLGWRRKRKALAAA